MHSCLNLAFFHLMKDPKVDFLVVQRYFSFLFIAALNCVVLNLLYESLFRIILIGY